MQRSERHYHTNSVSGALYTTRWRSVCRKTDVKQCCLQFPAQRRQWLDFSDRIWRYSRNATQQPETRSHQWWIDVSVVRLH